MVDDHGIDAEHLSAEPHDSYESNHDGMIRDCLLIPLSGSRDLTPSHRRKYDEKHLLE